MECIAHRDFVCPHKQTARPWFIAQGSLEVFPMWQVALCKPQVYSLFCLTSHGLIVDEIAVILSDVKPY